MFTFHLAILALPIIGAAAGAIPPNTCSTGSQQCCDIVQNVRSRFCSFDELKGLTTPHQAESLAPLTKILLGAIGVDVNDLTGLVGGKSLFIYTHL